MGVRTYALWQEGPWELPKPAKGNDISPLEEPKTEGQKPQLASTKNIVEKNLFDPERGASRTREAEASTVALQRMRSMVLLGTAILGSSRYAILQGPADGRPAAAGSQAGAPSNLRLKLGDTVEGFKLSEIHEKSVVFTKGTSRVEVALDFFRKVEKGTQGPPAPQPGRPGVVPNVPRRPGVPAPPVTQ